MRDETYSRFDGCDLILRDELAIDRTVLANERTLLAYLRSAVALFLAGVSIINYSQALWFTIVGYVSIPAAIVAGVVGVVRYLHMRRSIAAVRRNSRSKIAPLLGPTD